MTLILNAVQGTCAGIITSLLVLHNTSDVNLAKTAGIVVAIIVASCVPNA